MVQDQPVSIASGWVPPWGTEPEESVGLICAGFVCGRVHAHTDTRVSVCPSWRLSVQHIELAATTTLSAAARSCHRGRIKPL